MQENETVNSLTKAKRSIETEIEELLKKIAVKRKAIDSIVNTISYLCGNGVLEEEEENKKETILHTSYALSSVSKSKTPFRYDVQKAKDLSLKFAEEMYLKSKYTFQIGELFDYLVQNGFEPGLTRESNLLFLRRLLDRNIFEVDHKTRTWKIREEYFDAKKS